MRRGGYDRYDYDEAIRQSGHGFGDVIFGRPRSINERIRLGIAIAAAVALGASAFFAFTVFLPVFVATFVATIAAVSGSDWLTRPYRGSGSHGLVAGLTTSALFLLLLLLVLPSTLISLSASTDRAYVVSDSILFTLILAVPAWLIWLIWGLFRRASTAAMEGGPAWRLALPSLVIVGAILLLARAGSGL